MQITAQEIVNGYVAQVSSDSVLGKTKPDYIFQAYTQSGEKVLEEKLSPIKFADVDKAWESFQQKIRDLEEAPRGDEEDEIDEEEQSAIDEQNETEDLSEAYEELT